MTDYGHPITFGLSLYPSVDLLRETRQLAQAADAGLDYIAIQDHAYNPEFLDVWTLISYLAADTDRILFFPDVADLQLRPPTILAKAAASLSVLTGGRIALGVGGGASADGIAAMGGIRRNGREMVAFTDEALQLMRRALAGGVVDFRGGQYTIEGYAAGAGTPGAGPAVAGQPGAADARRHRTLERRLDLTAQHLSNAASGSVPAAADRRGRALGRTRPGGLAPHLQRRWRDRRGAWRSRIDRRRAILGRRAHRLVRRPGLRHVRLLADDRAPGPTGGIRHRGRSGCAAARERTSRPTMTLTLAAAWARLLGDRSTMEGRPYKNGRIVRLYTDSASGSLSCLCRRRHTPTPISDHALGTRHLAAQIRSEEHT